MIHLHRFQSMSLQHLLMLSVLLIKGTIISAKQDTKSKCIDNPSYRFTGKQKKNCSWVNDNPIRRCSFIDDNNVKVSDECCGTCSQIDKNRNVGQFCARNNECSSGVCKKNTCYASQDCEAVKHLSGTTFDSNKIILVFVGSGFTDLSSWRNQIRETFSVFNSFDFFGYENDRYTAFFVDTLEEDFCEFNCQGFDTLLCCNQGKATKIASKCFPKRSTLQTIVIHNSDEYGGGGYRTANIGTTSTHEEGPYVAVHELGHSLFELADEYQDTHFSHSDSANCDVKGCPKWADLDEYEGGGLCINKGCEGGNSFVGEESFMQYLDKPFGDVNLRFTCCTYLALTKGMPHYCKRFDEVGDGLVNYCKRDYQGYGSNSYQNLPSVTFDEVNHSAKYVVVRNAALVIINVESETFEYAESSSDGSIFSLERKQHLYGDFPDPLSAFQQNDIKSLLKVNLKFDSGFRHTLYFEAEESIEEPPAIGVRIDVPKRNITTLEVVVDSAIGDIIEVHTERIENSWWMMVRLWLSDLFRSIFPFLFKKSEEQYW